MERTVKEHVSDIAENPYVKAVSRSAMIFTTFIAAPVIYWVISTMLSVNNSLSTIVLIQQNQQQQVQQLVATNGTIISTQAQEAQTRAVTDAQLSEQVKNVSESIKRAERSLQNQDARINELYQRMYDSRR